MKAADIKTKTSGASNAPKKKHQDLEVKDAQIIFNAVWNDLESTYGRERLHFPREMILLGGAPGAGKGTNTPFIMEARGLTCDPIVVSGLLDTPKMRQLKEAGQLVGDTEVVRILFEKMLESEYADGCWSLGLCMTMLVPTFVATKVAV